MELRPGDRERKARFDRFGNVNLRSSGHAVEIYLDELTFTRGKSH